MSLELVRPTSDAVAPLGSIFFVAFKELLDRHGLELDIPTLDVANWAMGMFISRPDFYGVAARLDGQLVGSNFASYTDPVAGVGPITVKPGLQARGVGKALMKHVVDHALANHGPRVRLVQDAINMVSLSLYTSLGFDVREPLVLLTLPPAESADPSVRPVTQADLTECSALFERIYGVSRVNELALTLAHGAEMGTAAYLREREGRIVGYAIPGFFGHGVAETNDDLLTILRTGMRTCAPSMSRFLCPSRNADLYRKALAAGARALRGLHLMSIGPYTEPTAAWFPSIAY